MPETHKFVRLRAALLGISVLAFAACDGNRLTDPTTDVPGAVVAQPVDAGTLAFATAGTGGIPFGFFHMPTTDYGTTYTGALRVVSPFDYSASWKRHGRLAPMSSSP